MRRNQTPENGYLLRSTSPDDTLRRGQAAAFLHRLAGEPSAPPHSFVDVVAGWQQAPVSWMANTGITTGTSPTTFAPEVTLTRAHLVTFLYRYQGEPDVTINTSTPVCNPVEPDLGVGSPAVNTSAPLAGERLTLSVVVRNLGDGRSASTTLRYYQSTDATITTADTEVGTDAVFRLDAQETEAESVSVTAPSEPGTYYYGACVDSLSDESDTTNNCSTAVTVTVRAAPVSDASDDLFTVELTKCEGERWPFGDRVDVTIAGTITAKRKIDAQYLMIEIKGIANGQSLSVPGRIFKSNWNAGRF